MKIGLARRAGPDAGWDSVHYPENFRYTKEHQWVDASGGAATIGITHHAQEQLGDIVYVDLPKPGFAITQGETFGSVESVKAVSDIFAPVSGEVVEVNGELGQKPEIVNQDPYGKGWMLLITPSGAKDIEQLLTAAQYEEFLAQGSH